MTDAETALWDAYGREPSDDARNALALFYWPRIARLAGRLAWKQRGSGCIVAADDLAQAGLVAVMEALPAHRRGARGYWTWLARRALGGMKDAIRACDHVQHTARYCAGLVEAIDAQEPGLSEAQVAKRLRVSRVTVRHLRDLRAQMCPPLRLDGPVGEDGDMGFEGLLPAPGRPVGHEAEAKEAAERALRGLLPRERLILTVVYGHGWTMQQAGALVGASQSRVSQVVADALVRVRERGNDERAAD